MDRSARLVCLEPAAASERIMGIEVLFHQSIVLNSSIGITYRSASYEFARLAVSRSSCGYASLRTRRTALPRESTYALGADQEAGKLLRRSVDRTPSATSYAHRDGR